MALGTSFIRLLYRNLNQREPLLGVLLVPYAVDVACARMSYHLVALLLHVGEGFGKRLIEALVGTHMLHAQRLGHGSEALAVALRYLEDVLQSHLIPYVQGTLHPVRGFPFPKRITGPQMFRLYGIRHDIVDGGTTKEVAMLPQGHRRCK